MQLIPFLRKLTSRMHWNLYSPPKSRVRMTTTTPIICRRFKTHLHRIWETSTSESSPIPRAPGPDTAPTFPSRNADNSHCSMLLIGRGRTVVRIQPTTSEAEEALIEHQQAPTIRSTRNAPLASTFPWHRAFARACARPARIRPPDSPSDCARARAREGRRGFPACLRHTSWLLVIAMAAGQPWLLWLPGRPGSPQSRRAWLRCLIDSAPTPSPSLPAHGACYCVTLGG
jgi:hypothetical protein